MNEKTIQILDESGDKKMLWETIGKPAYEKGLLEGRQESGLFAVIPMSILENKNLSANAKLLYGEIMALSKKSGLCYATNEYMADMIGLSKRSIPQILKELSGCGLIFVDIKRSKKGTYRNILVSFFNKGGHRCRTMGGVVKERGGASLDNEDKIEIDKIEINNKKNTSAKAVKENWVKEILIWLEERRKIKFADYGKQISALGRLKKAGYEPEKIKKYMKAMEKNDFWRDKSPDFVTLAAHIHRIR